MSSETQTETPTIPGPYQQAESESSPLKKTLLKKRNWFRFFGDWESAEPPGSLKSTVVVLFGTTAVISLALLTQVYYGDYQLVPHGSVTSDSEECSELGLQVLRNGGSAVDAAVACVMCLGVINFHVTGLGGGGYMMVYNHKKKEMLDVIDFRETVPESYGHRDLDINNDGLMVGVPGLVMGLWEAHAKHGKQPWADLLMPSVNIARNGFLVPQSVFDTIPRLNLKSNNSKKLADWLHSLTPNESISHLPLAAALELIAEKGPKVFYNGSLADEVLYAVKVANGSMTTDDISKYRVSRSKLLQTRLGNFDILVPESSSGGALLLNALDAIQVLDLNLQQDDDAQVAFKMADILHDAYVSFIQNVQAPYEQPVAAASHVAVMDKDENYVSVVTGLNTWLGSQILTDAGFILNNAIANGGINSERRPMSTATPVIVFQPNNICGRRLVLGGDATILAQVLTELLILNQNTSLGVEYPRFHIDNIPRSIKVEANHMPFFSAKTLEQLKMFQVNVAPVPGPYNSVNVIDKKLDTMTPIADTRGGGASAVFR